MGPMQSIPQQKGVSKHPQGTWIPFLLAVCFLVPQRDHNNSEPQEEAKAVILAVHCPRDPQGPWIYMVFTVWAKLAMGKREKLPLGPQEPLTQA